jgi:hypothetical protein
MIPSQRPILAALPKLFVGLLVSVSVAACGGSKDGPKAPTKEGLPTEMEHEDCDVTSGSAQKLDTNGDGKPDIVKVMSGGRESCRMVDLNHDDKPDAYIYFDASGAIRRRESDFDRDGKIDEIAYYTAGVITRKDRETNLDGKLDTWDFYEGGKLHHRMRDSDGDGKVDQWWSWANPDKIECAVIASDHKGDGKPDPSNVIDVCAAPGASSVVDAGTASTSPPQGGDAGATLAASLPSGADAGAAPPAAVDSGKAKKETK